VSLRRAMIGLLSACLLTAIVAGSLALNPLVLHGFAPACSDGYAEAHGIAPCKPDWDQGAPYLTALGLALAGAAASAAAGVRGKRTRQLS
jgi:hypothetical protein